MKLKSDEGQYIYLADIAGQPNWIQVLKVGTMAHPEYGQIAITPEKLQNMVKNYKDGVRGIDLAINYAHGNDNAKGDKAAGWFQDVEVRDGGLWALPSWTGEASGEIRDGAWRYMSAEYRDRYTNAETGQEYNDVLVGAALTNKPFIKGMAPVNFEEVDLRWDEQRELPTAEEIALWEDYTYVPTTEELDWLDREFRDIPQSKRNKMPSGSFAGKGTSFPIEQCSDVRAAWIRVNTAGSNNYPASTLYANIRRIAAAKGFTKCLPKTAQTKAAQEGGEMDDFLKKLAEKVGLKDETDEDKIYERAAKLADFFIENKDKTLVDPKDAKERKFEEDYPEQAKQLADQAKKIKTDGVTASIKAWNEAGLPPVVNDRVKAYLLGETIELDEGGEKKQVSVEFGDIVDGILKAGIVNTKHSGSTSEQRLFDSPQSELAAETKKLMEANKELKYLDARRQVLREHPDLAGSILHAVDTGPKASGDE